MWEVNSLKRKKRKAFFALLLAIKSFRSRYKYDNTAVYKINGERGIIAAQGVLGDRCKMGRKQNRTQI